MTRPTTPILVLKRETEKYTSLYVRCDNCGSNEPIYICMGCGKYLCQEHKSFSEALLEEMFGHVTIRQHNVKRIDRSYYEDILSIRKTQRSYYQWTLKHNES
jgi:hypothetical protein